MTEITNPFFRFVGNVLSPAGPRARLSILIYHRVLLETDPLFPTEVTVETFDRQMTMLKSVFNVLPLPEAVARLKAGTLPARPACITFDDGYADNVTNALPILQKHRLHATFFIATAYLNGGRMFNDTVIESIRRSPLEKLDLCSLELGIHPIGSNADKATAIGSILPKVKYLPLDERDQVAMEIAQCAGVTDLPNDLMMTTEQLKVLHAAGMEIGGHTHRHPILALLDDVSTRAEIEAGKQWLEEALNCRTRLFAYPNGKPGVDYLPEQARIVEALGFDAAVSTRAGISSMGSDAYQLRRYTPWAQSPNRFNVLLARNLSQR